MFRNRLWYELTQAKHNERYLCFLIAYNRRMVNSFNICIAIFSTAGIMGWKVWEFAPIAACAIISAISIAKLIQPYIIPSEKQIEKLDKVCDFYFDQYFQFERIFFDYDSNRITEVQAQEKYMALKQSEREINKIINEVHRNVNRKQHLKAEIESLTFFKQSFNT